MNDPFIDVIFFITAMIIIMLIGSSTLLKKLYLTGAYSNRAKHLRWRILGK